MESSTAVPGPWYKRLCTFVWYDLLYWIYLGAVLSYKELFTSPPKADIEKMEKRSDQVVVITGGPRGLALGLIKRLVELDYTIIMGARNIEDSKNRLSTFADSINISTKKIKIFEMDLMSLDSVRKFADDVLRETSRIDLLLCNAAIMRAPYQLSSDGYESQFQVNYLSNFLLTHLLLEKLKKTATLKEGSCQVIYTSSALYQFGKFRPDEFEKPIVYTPYKFYYPSKLYPVMAMLHMQQQLDKEGAKVYCYAVHPGLIYTDLWYSAGGYLGDQFARLISGILRSVENAADTILWPIISPKFSNQGGLYMESGASNAICKYANNKDTQSILYERSLKLVGLGK